MTSWTADRARRSGLLCVAVTTAALAGCSSMPAEQPTSPAPEHLRTIAQVQESGRLRFVVCATCPERTTKTLPGLAAASQTKLNQPAPITRAEPPSRRSRQMVATVRFDFAKADITAHAHAALDSLRPVLSLASDLTVTGFTDDLGPMGLNTRLAEDRADAVVKTLAFAPSADSTRSPGRPGDGLGVIGSQFGVQRGRPLCCYVAPNTSDAERAQNRRVEIAFTVPGSLIAAQALRKASAVADLRDAEARMPAPPPTARAR